MKSNLKIGIVGGGASGFFAALRAADVAYEEGREVEISILESSTQFLKKVRISGGGRCNVTHFEYEISKFVQNYPRGEKELISPFHQFQAKDTVDWFLKRGVNLIAEGDGRMFPDTHQSETIIQCFLNEADKLNVHLFTQKKVTQVNYERGQFICKINNDSELIFDRLLLATGSAPMGYELASQLGHKITERAPSLFSFKIEDPFLNDLMGTSFKNAILQLEVNVKAKTKTNTKTKIKKYIQEGPLLITHWGLSGPAILKLSAWAARDLKNAQYMSTLKVNWLGVKNEEVIFNKLIKYKKLQSQSKISNTKFGGVTQKFWIKLLEINQIDKDKIWSEVNKKELQNISQTMVKTEFLVHGKNRFKQEFVECGGVSLKEIHLKTMESKICPHLFFSGELMDIDGVTGGFNFQNAWTAGWIAGTNMAV